MVQIGAVKGWTDSYQLKYVKYELESPPHGCFPPATIKMHLPPRLFRHIIYIVKTGGI